MKATATPPAKMEAKEMIYVRYLRKRSKCGHTGCAEHSEDMYETITQSELNRIINDPNFGWRKYTIDIRTDGVGVVKFE